MTDWIPPPAWVDNNFDSLDLGVELDIDPEAVPGDLALMDADAALAEILDCERDIAAMQARQIRTVAHFAALRYDDRNQRVDEFAADELAPLLRISRTGAQARLDQAVELTGRLPGTVASLERGEIDLCKAKIVANHTHPLTAEHAAAVESSVLPDARAQTPGQLHAALRRAVLRVDPDGAEARRTARVRERAVTVRPQPDGTAELTATNLDAADAVAAYQQLDTHAMAMGSGDGRSMDQRRADALIDLILGRAEAHASGASVHVTVAATTLLGLDELPAELAGFGSITAQAARELAADGIWRRILTDPLSGTVLDVGRTRYRPSTALADHVRVRDRTCRFPGCRQPARRCDIDHVEPFPQGGTDAENLCCLCRHHHRLKHERNWSVQHGESGRVVWTSPTGRTYDTRPESVADVAPSSIVPPVSATGEHPPGHPSEAPP